MKFIAAIREILNINEELENRIKESFKKKSFPKNHCIHEYGNVATCMFFIEEGLCRTYYINENGKDLTYNFYKEGDFMTIAESFFDQKPSRYSIETLEEVNLYYIQFSDLEDLLRRYPILERMKSHVLQYFLLIVSSRVIALQFQTAQQRYDTLITQDPEILQRASLGHIASYLGITQETLSRIRAKK